MADYRTAGNRELGWRNIAMSGLAFATRETTAATRYGSLDGYPVGRLVLVSGGGETEIINGMTAAQVINEAYTYNMRRRTIQGVDYIMAYTIPPSHYDATIYDASKDAVRVSYNAQIKADPSIIGADRVFDLAALPESSDPDNATYYVDKLHPTAALALIWGAALCTAYLS